MPLDIKKVELTCNGEIGKPLERKVKVSMFA